jgi:phosphatidylserine synthase
MSFIKFVFSFLFVRNWHTGEMELSRSRMSIFCAAVFLVLLALTMISFLQAPVEAAAQ